MAAFAYQYAWLKCTFHDAYSIGEISLYLHRKRYISACLLQVNVNQFNMHAPEFSNNKIVNSQRLEIIMGSTGRGSRSQGK